MKKITFLFLSLVWSYSSYCQKSKITLGLELTPTMNSIRGNSFVNSFNPLFSFSTGLNIEYIINDKYSIKSGLTYDKKGAKTEIDYRDANGGPLTPIDVRENFNYLVLPILGSFSSHGNTKFYFDAGPYIGFLLSQKEIWESNGSFPGKTSDYTASTKKIDLGLSLGLGVKIPLKDHWLILVGLKENLGLINTSKYLAVDNSSVKTNSFGIQLSFKYKL
jgi:hypothetical protein